MSKAHQVQEGNKATGTVNRPATPMYEKVGEEWVSKGWNELDHKGWLFKAVQRPALNEAAHNQLSQDMGIPLPSAVFLDNSLSVSNNKTGIAITFSCQEAIRDWAAEAKKIGSGGWQHVNPFIGTVSTDKEKFREMLREAKRIEATEFARPVATRMRIPMDLLQQKSHIFFYDSVVLAQDKGPEGESEVSVKIRVMESFFLILLRCYLVTPHGVLMRDVRWFHRFGDKFVLQDVELRQASLPELENAVARMRPVSASVSDRAKHDQRYFANPEQVWEALQPSVISNNLVCVEF